MGNLSLRTTQALPDALVTNLCSKKRKVRPGTSREGPEGECRYSSVLSLTSAIDGVGG